jgi:hypothetical protein
MFEFHTTARCPYCDHDNDIIAVFNNDMMPVKTNEECAGCMETYTVSPYQPDIEVDTEKWKKPRKKKE